MPASDETNAREDREFVKHPIQPDAFKVMKLFFEYDREMPLNARIVEKLETNAYIREKIVFSSVHDNRVPAFLGIPNTGKGPFPCVLILHGVNGSKQGWWRGENEGPSPWPKLLLENGFAVLTLDAQYHGERLCNNDFESPTEFIFKKGWRFRERDMFVQTTVDYRRAIDYLESRFDMDSSRIGMLGYSMGGMITFFLTAVDQRIKAATACATPILEWENAANAVHNFAPYIENVSFQMLMGKTDPFFTEGEAQQLYNFIKSETKVLHFFDSGHGLPHEESTEKVMAWTKMHLK